MWTMRILLAGASLLMAVSLYPLALVLVLLADSLWGNAEFLHQVAFGSLRELLVQIASDWWAALPYGLVLWAVIRLFNRFSQKTVIGLSIASLLLILLAFFPPYLPLIFGALLLWATLLSLGFSQLVRKAPV